MKRFRPIDQPVDDMLFKVLDVFFGDRLVTNGDTGFMHGIRIAGHERVPPFQVLAIGNEPVATGLWQPAQRCCPARRQLDTIGHL